MRNRTGSFAAHAYTTTMQNSNTRAHSVAIAAPETPIAGSAPAPKINTAFKITFTTSETKYTTEETITRSTLRITFKNTTLNDMNRYEADTMRRYFTPSAITASSPANTRTSGSGKHNAARKKGMPKQ